jgi:hypothetical protein
MKIIIGAVVAVGIIAGAGTGYAVIKDSDLMCNYDPKSGNYKDPATGEWSAMGTWDHALACAKEGLLPQNVADRIGVWGSKEDQEIGRQAAETNKQVAKAKAEAKAEAEKAKAVK